VLDVDYSHNIAGGDMRTTVEDMAHFGDALTHPGLLSSQSLEMLYRQPRVGAVESSMSFGWFVSPADRRPTRININGANPGMQAAIYVYPAARLVIAIAANTWGVGSRSGDMTGSAPTQLPSRLAAVCMH
jgi:CubicO group peptidase (beta-lactamase class C family)